VGSGAVRQIIGLVVLSVMLAPPLSGAGSSDPFEAMAVHRPEQVVTAPDVVFLSLEGREVRLRDLRGKVVLLGFFTTS